jgi:tetratricopeptide (TPR) repeat protein
MAAVLRFGALAAPGLAGEDLGALEELRATAYRWHGQLEEAEASAAIAVRELPARDPRWFAAFSTQLCMRCVLGHTDGTAQLIAQLDAAALADGGDHAALAIGRLLGQMMLTDTAFDRAQTAVLERVFADVVARGPADKSDELAIVIADIAGERALEVSDHAGALILGEEVVAREARRGNTVPAQQQLAINGYYMYELGQIAEARAALETALAFAREHEVARLEAHAHHNLGVVIAQSGDLARAAAHERRALDYYSLQQDTRMVAGCRMYLAHILIAQGEVGEAEHDARAALATFAASKYAPFAWATLARALLGQGRLAEAADAIGNVTHATRMSEGWAWIAVTDAEIALQLGRRDHAEAVVRAACAEIDRRMAAPAFADPRWREAYLTGVEAHRRLAALRATLAI